MRVWSRILLAASSLSLLPVSTLASDATTTRIETRPFYGATVTLEAGVRVFRPLPPHSKVIINPNGRTPVSLGFEENRWVSHNSNYNYNYNEQRSAGDGDSVGGFVADGHKRHRPRHRPGRPAFR
ncbi:MAG: hypothetical protein HC869_25720 [Rhodospirillales bacterium]|nr:hypothetical protein [Rhodospirillales bacterium]